MLESSPALRQQNQTRLQAMLARSPWHVARQRRSDAFTTRRLVIRPSRPGDAVELVALVDQLVLQQHDWGPADVEHLRATVATSRDYNQSIICTQKTGKVAGAVGVKTEGLEPGECEIGVWFGPGYRWGGYAFEACEETISRLHASGFTVVHAATRETNRAVIRLYEKLGFEIVSVEKRTVSDGSEVPFVVARHIALPRQYRLHPDPASSKARREVATDAKVPLDASRSAAAEAYRASLALNDLPIRESVLDDLSTFYELSPDEALQRCIHWEEWSHEEWSRRERDSLEGSRDFYRTVQSWSFDLLWYAYLQAEGWFPPVSVAIAESFDGLVKAGSNHLDFGSGVGVTAQMMSRLGFQSEMADLSTSLLDFAHFRLSRRGMSIPSTDLSQASLGSDRYDVITAIDTLVHIPDLPDVLRSLHRALKPNGLLFTNFDLREPTPENHSFLYADDLPLKRLLTRVGFEAEESLESGGIVRYRRAETTGSAHCARVARDWVVLGPPRTLYRRGRNLIKY